MELALAMILLFVAVPVGLGYFIPSVGVARAVWLGLAAVLAGSQARDDDLGGAWILVAAVAGLALLLVQLGHYLRPS